MDKRFQRADWSRRPLTPEMEAYAALDTQHLAALCSRLEQRLEALGRAGWAAEEFARLEAIRWSERSDPEAYRRVKGSARLAARELAVLRALHGWRDAEARRRDRPPFRVMRDEQLLALARFEPLDGQELPGMTTSLRRGGAKRELREIISAARELPEEAWPQRAQRARRRPAPRRDPPWLRLRDARDALAKELDLEPAVVASRAALEQVLAEVEAGEEPAAAGELRHWQLELLLPTLRKLGA